MQEAMQKILDHVWDHFVTKGSPLGVENDPDLRVGGPCFRSSTGARCSVGLLIEDEEYRPAMEQMYSPQTLFTEGAEKLPKTMKKWIPKNATYEFYSFLSRLQEAHDHVVEQARRRVLPPPDEWCHRDAMRSALLSLSMSFGLDCPGLSEREQDEMEVLMTERLNTTHPTISTEELIDVVYTNPNEDQTNE